MRHVEVLYRNWEQLTAKLTQLDSEEILFSLKTPQAAVLQCQPLKTLKLCFYLWSRKKNKTTTTSSSADPVSQWRGPLAFSEHENPVRPSDICPTTGLTSQAEREEVAHVPHTTNGVTVWMEDELQLGRPTARGGAREKGGGRKGALQLSRAA